jgi:hypothetical protein
MQFLYDDYHPLLDCGNIRIERATNVTYNNKTHCWEVMLPVKKNWEPSIIGFACRADAIEAEKKYLEEKMIS